MVQFIVNFISTCLQAIKKVCLFNLLWIFKDTDFKDQSLHERLNYNVISFLWPNHVAFMF